MDVDFVQGIKVGWPLAVLILLLVVGVEIPGFPEMLLYPIFIGLQIVVLVYWYGRARGAEQGI